jgi:DNA helicase-2/ATP-dependent DNA helicase PcrA
LADAGSGKTEVVAQRVERLLAHSSDFRVLALSYTRRAAAELRDRFAARLGDERRHVETDTLHGFAQGLLIQYGTWIGLPSDPAVVVNDADRVDLFEAWHLDSGLDQLADPMAALRAVDLSRARGEETELTERWSLALAQAEALDYESMIARATDLLDVSAVRRIVSRLYGHIIVDEAQNLTASQYRLLSTLFEAARETSAMLVGDDKQSIVEFAGASAEFLDIFADSFDATTIRLTINFRSAQTIAVLGRGVAQDLGDSLPQPQEYGAIGQVELKQFADEASEGEGVADWVQALLVSGLEKSVLSAGESTAVQDFEIAVLARSAAALRATEAALIRRGIATAIAAHADDWLTSSFGREAWLLGTLRPDSAISRRRLMRAFGLILDSAETDSASLTELLDLLPQEVQPVVGHDEPSKFVEAIQSIDHLDDGDSWYLDRREITVAWNAFCDQQVASNRSWAQFELFVARLQRGDESLGGIRLHTVHKSQGREFRAVAVVGLNQGQFPDFRARSARDRKSELRAFYVATTRPSRALLLTRAESTTSRNGPWKRDPSEFLAFAKQALEI